MQIITKHTQTYISRVCLVYRLLPNVLLYARHIDCFRVFFWNRTRVDVLIYTTSYLRIQSAHVAGWEHTRTPTHTQTHKYTTGYITMDLEHVTFGCEPHIHFINNNSWANVYFCKPIVNRDVTSGAISLRS